MAVKTNTSFIIPCPQPSTFPATSSSERADIPAADTSSNHAVLYHRNIQVDIYGSGAGDGDGDRITKFGNNFHVRHARPSDSGRWSCERTNSVAAAGGGAQNIDGGTAVMLTDVIVSEVNKLAVFVMGEIVTNSVINLRKDFPVDIICSILSPVSGTTSRTKVGDKIPLAWSRPGDLGWVEMTHPSDIYDSSGEPASEHSQYISSSLVKVSSRDVINNNYNQISCHSDHKRVVFQVVEEYRPEFTISRSPGFGVPILEDMRVTLKCIVESNPTCLPVWEHNGVRVNTSVAGSDLPNANWAQLTFEKISPYDEGWYSCTTSHKFGNFSSVGYYLGVKPQTSVTAMGSNGGLGNGATTASLISDQVLWIDSGGAKEDSSNDKGGGVEQVAGGCEPDRHRNQGPDYAMPILTPEFKNIR